MDAVVISAARKWSSISLLAIEGDALDEGHLWLTDDELAARGLPEVAYVDNTYETARFGAPVLAIRRGEMGFRPVFTKRTAEELNRQAGVTELQAIAMHTGSMFGWDVPGARPWIWMQSSARGPDTGDDHLSCA